MWTFIDFCRLSLQKNIDIGQCLLEYFQNFVGFGFFGATVYIIIIIIIIFKPR